MRIITCATRYTLNIKFFKPTFANTDVQPKLKLIDKKEDDRGTTFTFEAWGERGDGQKTLGGTVKCLLPK